MFKKQILYVIEQLIMKFKLNRNLFLSVQYPNQNYFLSIQSPDIEQSNPKCFYVLTIDLAGNACRNSREIELSGCSEIIIINMDSSIYENHNGVLLSTEMNEVVESCNEIDLQNVCDENTYDSDEMKELYGFRDASPFPYEIYEDNSGLDPLLTPRSVKDTGKPSRKRKSNPLMWKRNIKKVSRESGLEYVSSSGKHFPPRALRPSICGLKCTHKCCSKFSESMRQSIHDQFWKLSDESKRSFYAKYVKRIRAVRQRTSERSSRRKNTFKYSLEYRGQEMKVCKTFFFATLDISQQRIYYFFKYSYNDIGSPKLSMKGKNSFRQIAPEKKQTVRQHIESFPSIDSHYVRQKSQKQYLESKLNLSKMYKLYAEVTLEPVKLCTYRKIFNEEYNLSFYKPRKDMCDLCTEFNNKQNPTENEKTKYSDHRNLNERAKIRREEDRLNINPKTALVLYDLQSVFTLPHSNVSNFYYKRKLSMYNLTGWCNKNKTTYCSHWYESQSGRSGNDIASGLIKILKAVIADIPDINEIILWSDSCIPQNKNRITSLAILKFLEEHSQVQSVQQRYSVPGHSRIQELDAVHSVIDRHLKHIHYYSPLSLIRELKCMDYNNVKLKIMQCSAKDFFNYSRSSEGFCFIPYNKAKEIVYNDLFKIKYRESYGDDTELKIVSIIPETNKRALKKQALKNEVRLPKVLNTIMGISSLSKEKKSDIKSMLPWMPQIDVEFYNILLKAKQ